MTSLLGRFRNTLPAVMVIAGLMAMTLPGAALAQEPDVVWSEPEPVSDAYHFSWFPEIHVDEYGTVRAIWETNRQPNDPRYSEAGGGMIMLAELREDGWSDPADIYAKDVLNAGRPLLASDGEYLHVVSRSPRPEGSITIQNLSRLYYMRAPLSGDVMNAASWSEPVHLTTGPSYWARLVTQPDKSIVLVYNQVTATMVDGKTDSRTALFSRRSTDQGVTWSPPTRVSEPGERVARSSLIASPVDGTLTVAWDSGYDNLSATGEPDGVYTAVSDDGGLSWESIARLAEFDAEEGGASHASAGAIEQGTVATNGELTIIAYRAIREDILLYRTSSDQGRTWSDELSIPDAIARPYGTPHHFDKLALVVDGDGRFVLAYVGTDEDAPNGFSVMSTTFYNGEWSEPVVISSPNGYPDYPRLAVASGNQIHLAYHVRDRVFVDSAESVIWTAQATTPAGVIPSNEPPPTPEESSVSETQVVESENDTVEVDVVPYPTRPALPTPIAGSVAMDSPQSERLSPALFALGITGGAIVFAGVTVTAIRRLTG